MYLTVCLLPLFLAAYFRVYHPELVGMAGDSDPQTAIPRFVLEKMNPWVSLLFVGALISAILSTASAAILAPAAVLSENIIPRLLGERPDSRRLLRLSRLSVLGVSAVALAMALSRSNIHELVVESSALSLVSLFVPLVAGLWFPRAGAGGALLSMGVGLIGWLGAQWAGTVVSPLWWGLCGGVVGMVVGSLFVPKFVPK
jgi:Na+/proline symporter